MRISSSTRSIGMYRFLLLLATSLALADDPAPKASMPDAVALATATKLVDEVHKDDFAAAKTPGQKAALSQLLIGSAKDEKDAAARFALLSKAKDIAVTAGDYQTAAAAVDEIGATFSVDALKMKSDAATATAKLARTPDQKKQLVAGASDLADTAIVADRYDVARTAADVELGCARAASDPDPVKTALAHVQQVRDTEAAFINVRKLLAVLADKPSDPDANLKLGKFTCFMKGDWKSGLPMLASGSDSTLKVLAEKDVAGATSAGEQIKLGDGWWDVAAKLTGATRNSVQRHAATWYRMALPSLSGLTKAKVEQRLAAVDETRHSAVRKPQVVNLLRLVNPDRDSVEGTWSLKEGVLTSSLGATARLQLPYHPPAEYDFRIEFVREQGNNEVVMILAVNGKQFTWTMAGGGNAVSGFGHLGSDSYAENRTTIRASGTIENGKRYQVTVKVRRGGVQAFVNDRLASEWQTTYGDVSLHKSLRMRDQDAVGLSTWDSLTSFSKVEVVEVSGPGEVIQDKATTGSGINRDTFAVYANKDWQPTIDLKKGQTVMVKATGEWCIDPAHPQQICGPDGVHPGTADLFGSLCARVGSGRKVCVGSSGTVTAETNGVLELSIAGNRAGSTGQASVSLAIAP